ncbi:MAG TPA: SDR family oxidoreductase [Candidatus Binataceae bacterium]|nr:SDR family oxidoreductase [Candidatus Binataceae bacterium]
MPESSAPSALAGKVAIVTGASRGIGRAIALKLASAGCDVAAVYFNAHDQARALCQQIAAAGGRAAPIAANVASPESVAELFGKFSERFNRLDIVVSNAASGVLKPTMEMTLKHWRWCMETNALALSLIAQRAAPLMGEDGRIVALSSLGARFALPDYGFIGASKAALESLVRSLAIELGRARGIRVNAVSAAVVDTDALKAFRAREQMLREFAERAALGPALTEAHVADAVFLLCLPEAAMITGQTLIVDGGFSISG